MTDQQKIREIVDLITFLKIHVQNFVSQSFTDLTFDLESLVKDYLNVFEDSDSIYYSQPKSVFWPLLAPAPTTSAE